MCGRWLSVRAFGWRAAGQSLRLYDNGDLAAGVMFQHVCDGTGSLVERVGLLDDHPDLVGFEKTDERVQVLAVHGERDELDGGGTLPISVARATLGRPASSPPVFPMLFGMSTPLGASSRAAAFGEWFSTLSKMTS